MKRYHSIGPNARIGRLYVQEKGLDIETQGVDIMGEENCQDHFGAVESSSCRILRLILE